jgi:ATP-binding cassette subfamily B protein
MAIAFSGKSFKRVRELVPGISWQVAISGILLALFPPILLVLLGLMLETQSLEREGAEAEAQQTRPDQAPAFFPSLKDEYIALYSKAFSGADSTVAPQLTVAVVAAIVALFQAVVGQWHRRAVYRAARRITSELKRRLHSHVFTVGTQDSLGEERAWPQELLLEKTEMVRRGLVAWYRLIPHSLVLLVLLLVLALCIHLWLAIGTTVLAVLLVRFDRWLRDAGRRHSHVHAQHAQMADQLLAETMRLAPLATGYAMTPVPAGPVADWLRQQEQEGYYADVAAAARTPWYWMIVVLCVILWSLILVSARGATLTGNLVMALAIAAAWFPLRRLQQWSNQEPEYERAAREIFAYLDRPAPVQELPGAEPLPRLERQLQLDSVTVIDRQGHKLLREVSCTIKAGSRVAVVSSDPRTPRALIELLPRLVDPASGRLLFDDKDLRFATIASVRQQTLLVLKDALVFTGTVEENITCGVETFTTDQIHEAAKQAQAIDLILQLPDSFQTMIGEMAYRLPAWQAFRIALARALIRNPSVLVVEEPTEELTDAEREAVDKAIQQAAAQRTLILLPQRLSVLRNADTVLLFHEGQLIGQGKHSDLIQESELYRHLNYMWFNPFPHIR